MVCGGQRRNRSSNIRKFNETAGLLDERLVRLFGELVRVNRFIVGVPVERSKEDNVVRLGVDP